jgi:predicted metal-dependent hydrolase
MSLGKMAAVVGQQTSVALQEDDSFDYVVKRQRRKTIAVHVLADASVEVRVPTWLANKEVVKFVEQRADWIVTQRQNNLRKSRLIPGYTTGQRHYYLGQSYPLLITAEQGSRVALAPITAQQPSQALMQLADKEACGWHIGLREPGNADRVKKLLEDWYRQQAKTIFAEQMRHCFALFPPAFQQQKRLPEITVRKMRRRWGSCSSKGAVTLNLYLIKLPMACIDYVIVHELCHLQEFHHGREFYRLLAAVMPDWRERENLIERLSLSD